MTREGIKLIVADHGELRTLKPLDEFPRPTELFVVSNKWIK
jgi:hypothetical protein